MSEPPRVDRLRALATRVVETLGGIPAVRTLVATLEVYDGAGGGLTANGLAYSALIVPPRRVHAEDLQPSLFEDLGD